MVSKIRIITVSVIVLHFILTSFFGHYIAVQVGSQMGQAVANGLIGSVEAPASSEKGANEIYRNMKSKGEAIISNWRVPLFLMSLPLKPIIQPVITKIRKAWIYKPAISKEISKDQVRTRMLIIENVSNGLNSLAFGLVFLLAWKLVLRVAAKTKRVPY